MKINRTDNIFRWAYIWTLIAIIGSTAYLTNKVETDIKQSVLPINTGSINTGSFASGSMAYPIINTGTTAKQSLLEKLNRDYQGTIYKLPKQSTELTPGLSYSDRSQILVDYMTRNTLKVPRKSAEKAFIYIKLREKPSYPIFIYWHGSEGPKSGDLDLSNAVEKVSDTEYIFDTSAIPYKRYYDKKSDIYPWQSDINKGKSLYVAFASKGFDGNGIEQVIFYTKK